MTDVPTLTSATAANFCTWNPLDSKTAIASANLNSTYQTGLLSAKGTFGVTSGKWYWEVTVIATGGSGQEGIGIGKIDTFPPTGWVGDSTSSWGYWSDGVRWHNSGTSSYGASYTTGDVIGVALDMDAGTLVFYKNNTSQGTAYSSITGTITPVVSNQNTSSSLALNCGQRPFAYTPPTGFVALNTFNLPTPTIGATASTQAINYMGATTYSGDSTSNRVITTGGGSDFVWIKRRNSTTNNILFDVIRGAGATLYSNLTNAEAANGSYYVQQFGNTGFTLGTGGDAADNITGGTYVAWTWKANGTGVSNTAGSITSTVSANTSAGFSVVTYTGNGTSGATVGHGLGVAPKMVIVKKRNGADQWFTNHTSASATAGSYLKLDSTAAVVSGNADVFNNTNPSSTVVTLGTDNGTNASGGTYVAYCFSEVAGYSKFGSYTGNGSADGSFVYTGFRPAYVMVKLSSGTDSWFVVDYARDPFNTTTRRLQPNSSGAESVDSSAYAIDFTANGFKLRTDNGQINGSGSTYIYACFAQFPLNYANAR
jgi:hypothetical protein